MKYEVTIRNPFNGNVSGHIEGEINLQYFDLEPTLLVFKKMIAKEAEKTFPHSSVTLLCKDTDREWVLDENFNWKEK